MKKKILIVAIVLLVLFFGYGSIFTIQQNRKANLNRKKLQALTKESVQAISMQWNIYEYAFTEEERDKFFELFHEIELGAVTHEHETRQEVGCGVTSKLQIRTQEGEIIYMDSPALYGGAIIVINGIGYESSSEALNNMAEFLYRIENREFITANDQTPVSANFPFKEMKDAVPESITLKKGEKQYQFTQQEITEFCEKFWDQAVYDQIETYKRVKDIQEVFESELVIKKANGELITVQLNYKVIIINGESYLFKLQTSGNLYSYIKNRMEHLS